MADTQTAVHADLYRERGIMDALALLFSLLVGALSFAVAVWALVTRRFSLDGLLLVLLSLLFAAIFGGNFAWSVYRGEAQAIFRAVFRSRSPGM